MADQITLEQRDPLIGTLVHGFVVRRKLAEGGMGAVYVAEHERLPIHKVIKVLLPAYAQNVELLQRFDREADAASRLRHEHILKIDNVGTLPNGQPWLMTDLLTGQPLDEFLRTRGRLAEHRALLILLQLCSALQHAHTLGIIHRDLKPGNVFVCPTTAQPFAIKLLDFGIAKLVNASGNGAKTRSGSAMGTPSYMAVEQYDHADEVTPQADIFSLGVMTCEMVTGRLPWGNHDQAVLYHKQRTERPLLDGLSPGWQRVVQDALAVEPRHRPESARAYAVALASETPAIPPYVSSGAEMLRNVARDLMDNAPLDGETIRNQSNRDLVAPMSWSTLTPPEVAPAQATTISASVGVVAPKPQRRLTRARLALASLGACGLAVLVTFTIVRASQTVLPRASALQPTSIAAPPVNAASSSPTEAVPRAVSAVPAVTSVHGAEKNLPPATAPSAPSASKPSVTPAGEGSPAREGSTRAAEVIVPSTPNRPSALPPTNTTRTKTPAAHAQPAQSRPVSPTSQRAHADEPHHSKAPAADDDAFDPDSPTGR